MYISRVITTEFRNMMKQYPIVTLLGPRQSGKSTLIRKLYPKKQYLNLEMPQHWQLIHDDPIGFIDTFKKEGAILDEVQRAPILLSYLQTVVDESKKMGQFILTGSHQLELNAAISQSLAGRTALLKLLPLSMQELKKGKITFSANMLLLQGFYPRIWAEKLEPYKAYRNYFETYIEKDVRQIINVKNRNAFIKFIKLVAGRIGQILNVSSLANEVGVASNTIHHWLSVLAASFVIYLLEPYFENFGKRVIKSPKLYFTDVGLACYLLGIHNNTQLQRDPLRGKLLENLVIMDLIKYQLNRGNDPNVYYFRDNHGNEVDVILKNGSQLIPIEIKASKTYHSEFLKGINYFRALVGNRCQIGFLLYGGEHAQTINHCRLLNMLQTEKIWQYLD